MPYKKKEPVPLSSFDPRYKDLLVRGSEERFEIPCSTWNEAYRLQCVLCQYRKRLKDRAKGEPGEWEVLYNCVVSLPGKRGTGTTLVLYPRTSEFSHILDSLVGPSADKEGKPATPLLDHDPLEDLEDE